MEEWRALEEYETYEISNQGRVRRNRKTILRVTRGSSRPYVSLVVNGVQVHRGLSRLVAMTFLEPDREDFDTPIHLDGDPKNCTVDNLAWRPRWFALRHVRQFTQKPMIYNHVVRSVSTGELYKDTWAVVLMHGVLNHDVMNSILNGISVFPIGDKFLWDYLGRPVNIY